MGGCRFNWFGQVAATATVLAAWGCVQESGGASDPDLGPAHEWLQSETSLVRAIDPVTGATRIVMGYNDTTEIRDPTTRIFTPNYSFHGLSISNDLGTTWERLGQLPANPAQGVEGQRGDPWLAAAGSLVVYAGMTGPPGNSTTLPSADGVMLAVSTDGGATWPASGVRAIHTSAPGMRPDGPKVSLSHDGSTALVTWTELEGLDQHTWFAIVDNPGTSPLVGGPFDLDQRAGLSPPSRPDLVPKCAGEDTSSWAASHPVGVIAPSGVMYIARVVAYVRTDDPLLLLPCYVNRLDTGPLYVEVFRSVTEGQAWERILSEQLSINHRDGEMLAVRDFVTRPGTRPAFVVTPVRTPPPGGIGAIEEDVLPAFEMLRSRIQGTPAPPVRTMVQNIDVWRLPTANSCTSSGNLEESCPGLDVTTPYADGFVTIGGTTFQTPEPGLHWSYQPALWTGDAVANAADRRVGLSFYVQPYRPEGIRVLDAGTGAFRAPTELERKLTHVIGLVSADNGRTWSPGARLTVPVPGRPSRWRDTVAGGGPVPVVFTPCPQENNEYFGDYNGGTFASDTIASLSSVTAWADSRDGCPGVRPGYGIQHQHVFAARFPFGL